MIHEKTLVIDAKFFPPEGDDCDATYLVRAYMAGWRNFIVFNCAGQRYVGCGLGPQTHDVKIDVYGSCGDYLASGIDGAEITVHGNAQDQLGSDHQRRQTCDIWRCWPDIPLWCKRRFNFVKGNAAGRP